MHVGRFFLCAIPFESPLLCGEFVYVDADIPRSFF